MEDGLNIIHYNVNRNMGLSLILIGYQVTKADRNYNERAGTVARSVGSNTPNSPHTQGVIQSHVSIFFFLYIVNLVLL